MKKPRRFLLLLVSRLLAAFPDPASGLDLFERHPTKLTKDDVSPEPVTGSTGVSIKWIEGVFSAATAGNRARD